MNAPDSLQPWRKSSYSSTQTNCVEVERDAQHVRTRDTKARDEGCLDVSERAWRYLCQRV